jgi:PAS domain S-box-containing protein
MTSTHFFKLDPAAKDEASTSPQERIAELSRTKGETQLLLVGIATTLEEVIPHSAVRIMHISQDHQRLISDFISSKFSEGEIPREETLTQSNSPITYCINNAEELVVTDLRQLCALHNLEPPPASSRFNSLLIRRIRPTNGDCWGCLAVYIESNNAQPSFESDSLLKQLQSWIQLAVTIVERRLLEDSLRTAQIRFELAAKASGIGIFDWTVATNELFWTPQTLSIFGVDAGSLQHMYDDWRVRAHPEDVTAVAELLAAAFKEQARTVHTKSRFYRASGELRWVETIGEVVYNETGQPLRVIGTVQDTTDTLKAQQQILSDRRRLELALEAGELGFWDWHIPTGTVQFGGQWSSMLGYSPDEIESNITAWEKLIHPEDKAVIFEMLSKHLEGKTPVYETEHRLLAKNGSWIWVLDRGRVVERDENGAAVRAIGIHSNITEKRAVQEAMKEADKRKDEFLATLAHELRNPLAPIRTGLAIINRDPTSVQAMRAREMMERQLAHTVRLIDDLLEVSRITSGRLTLKKETVSAQSIIDTAIEASLPYINAAKHTLNVQSLSHEILIHCDPTRVAQTISNILNNAAKYTPDGGHIALTARTHSGFLEIEVRDNGVGIPPEMHDHVFDLFGQVNQTLDRAQGGLGIGLALVRTLVQLHGGEVRVNSAGAGKGSTFIIRLPCNVPSIHKPDNEPTLTKKVNGMNEKRVLIVDDNVDGAASLSMFAELLGHITAVAHSGPQALEKVQSFRPDVVFLDIGLPGMSGFEVAQLLRNTPQALHAKLVALTGWGSEETKRQAREVGFSAHLTKPVELSEIEKILEGE